MGNIFINSILFAAIFVVLGLILEKRFVSLGIFRTNTIGVVIITIFCVVLKQVMLSQLSWFVWGLVILVSQTVGVHRTDVWYTLERGRWWWKSGE